MSFIRNLKNNEKGATAIEYGLIAALISVSLIVAAGSLGTNLNAVFKKVSDEVGNATK